MYGARTLALKRKPRIILDLRFKDFSQLEVGDVGQGLLSGVVSGERKETSEDDTDFIVKTVEIEKIEVITQKDTRSNKSSL